MTENWDDFGITFFGSNLIANVVAKMQFRFKIGDTQIPPNKTLMIYFWIPNDVPSSREVSLEWVSLNLNVWRKKNQLILMKNAIDDQRMGSTK